MNFSHKKIKIFIFQASVYDQFGIIGNPLGNYKIHVICTSMDVLHFLEIV